MPSKDPQTSRDPRESERVALFMPSYRGGGAERVMVTIANGLAAEGHRVDLVVCDSTGPMRAKLNSGVEEVDLRARRMARALPGLYRYLRGTQPIALLSTLSHANVTAVVAARLARWDGRLVLRESTNLGALDPEQIGWRQTVVVRCVSWAYRHADAVIAGSEGMMQDLRKRGLRSSLLRVIPNPLELQSIEQSLQRAAGHPWLDEPGPPVILAAGRLIPDKGYDVLVDAFAQLRKRRVARLLILGEGPERPALERRVNALGIRSDVFFPGFIDPIFPWLGRCTVFVLSSRREGLPNTLIQALACGCRVVATDCPSGPAEILEGGKWGMLVPSNDVNALSKGMSEALDADPEVGEGAQLRARYYDVRRILPEYQSVLGLQKAPT